MSEDTTNKMPHSEGDALNQILDTVRSLDARLGGLEKKVDARLYDTRPIWEKVQADIAGLQEGQKNLTQAQLSLSEGQLRVTEGQLRFTEGQLNLVEGQKGLAEGQAGLIEGQRRLEERFEALRDEMRTGFHDFKRRVGVLNDDVLEVRADYKDLNERVCKLETEGVTENP